MHDADFPHDHDEAFALSVEMDGLETITLTSVGIDIGSSTSHLLFSKLTLRREGSNFSTRYRVDERRILWSSPVLLTPYSSATRIDFDALETFIDQGYRAAGFTRDDIDSGAVVITGEALKKENARPIAEFVAEQSGKFVCASAGPHHEAFLAAHGSGAVQLSESTRSRILLIDVGGGTTKIALIERGTVAETAAINIGARLVAFDATGTVTRLEAVGAAVAQAAGVEIAPGSLLSDANAAAIATLLASTLVSCLETPASMTPLARRLMITDPLSTGIGDVDYIMFSGGVSEFVYDDPATSFGDLGSDLGAALRLYAASLPDGMLLRPSQGIRATVIGAGEYTVQVSGMTSYSSGTATLPMFGLKVVQVGYGPSGTFSARLRAALRRFDLDAFEPGLVIATAIDGGASYPALLEIATGIAALAGDDPAATVVVNIEQDVAHALGRILVDELKLPNPLVCIDGIVIGDLDFVDIGRPIAGAAGVFPVTVKSLLFSAAPQL